MSSFLNFIYQVRGKSRFFSQGWLGVGDGRKENATVKWKCSLKACYFLSQELLTRRMEEALST